MLGMMYGGDINRATPSKMSFGGVGRWMFKKMMKAKNVTSLPEMRQTAIDLGVKLYGCQMSMDMMDLTEDDLIEGAEVLGAMEFMELSQDAQVLFV